MDATQPPRVTQRGEARVPPGRPCPGRSARVARSAVTFLGAAAIGASLLGCGQDHERDPRGPDLGAIAEEAFVAEDLQALSSADSLGSRTFVRATLGLAPPLRLVRIAPIGEDGRTIAGVLAGSGEDTIRFRCVVEGAGGGGALRAYIDPRITDGAGSSEADAGSTPSSEGTPRPLAVGGAEERALILALLEAARPHASRGDTVWMAGGSLTALSFGVARGLQEQRNRAAGARRSRP